MCGTAPSEQELQTESHDELAPVRRLRPDVPAGTGFQKDRVGQAQLGADECACLAARRRLAALQFDPAGSPAGAGMGDLQTCERFMQAAIDEVAREFGVEAITAIFTAKLDRHEQVPGLGNDTALQRGSDEVPAILFLVPASAFSVQSYAMDDSGKLKVRA